jgi:leader peptidase (prepilin peptidase)/N-methyltransferase
MDNQIEIFSICFNFLYVILGLCVGSFLNVCIYRIPAGREDLFEESIYAHNQSEKSNKIPLGIATPTHSICPFCKHRLLWWQNLPVISWILLRGKCGFCSHAIPFRYPFVEAITGLFAALTFSQFGFSWTAAVIFIFVCSLIVISFIDYDFYIIPNVISLPGTAIGFGLAALNHFTHIFKEPIVAGIPESALGVLLGAGFLWFIAEVYLRVRKIEGLGMGDVKLLAMTGALFGTEGAFYTIFIGSLLGSIIGLGLILFTGRKASQHIPFGPYLAFATILYIYSGNSLINWWFGILTGGGIADQ